jgi:hypothetical protein
VADDPDDNPPPRRRLQTSTDRDAAGLARIRRDRELERLAKSRDRKSTDLRGVPAVPRAIHDPDTGRTTRIEQDPDLNILYVRSEHNRALIAQQNRETKDAILEVAGERPPEERFAKVEKGVKIAHWIITAIAVPAISATLLVGKYIVTKAREDERALIQREADRAQIAANTRRINELEAELAKLTAPKVTP